MKNKNHLLVLVASSCVVTVLATIVMLSSNMGHFLIYGVGVNNANTVWGHYERIEPTLDTDGCQEYWISCDNHEIRYVQPTEGKFQHRTLTAKQFEILKNAGDRRYLPKWRIDEEHVSFGMYPTTKITDSTRISILTNQLSVTNPSAASHEGWTTFDYYVSDALRNDDHANGGIGFYQDLFFNGAYFRAVYFRFLRPLGTQNPANVDNSNVDNNGYDKTTLYFFEFTPIEWRILEEDSSSIKMLSTTILDSWQYDHDPAVTSFDSSDIRSFINGTFYNDAFKTSQNKMLNVYSSDKVTLLSFAEAESEAYGFTTTIAATEKRQFAPSDYALSQGAFKYNNYGEWALRDLKSDSSPAVRYNVLNNGSITTTNKDVRYTYKSGVLPVISLSKN